MDVSLLLQHSQYGIPVGIVLVCAILVFVFGFKKAEQPPFAQLSVSSDVDRKLASKKRSKTREKKAANGQVTTEKASPAKKVASIKAETAKKSSETDKVDGKLKERKQEDNKPATIKKEKNQEAKSGKENKIEQVKNKKNLKNLLQEKPVDFDEGDWEQAYSRKDKKNKKKEEDTPSKKTKKTAKKTDLINDVSVKDQEKPEIKDKVAKETENKELKEKDNKEVVLTPIISDVLEQEKVVEKKAEVSNKVEKPEKEEKKKSKKSKKISESDGTTPTPKTEPKVIDKVVEKKVEEVIVKDVPEPVKSEQNVGKAAPVFDELGDVWTEAKPQKKSKKKARKDN